MHAVTLSATPDWFATAACRGHTSLFFDRRSEQPLAREYREDRCARICAACDHLAACREWARDHREAGYWGGESERDRVAAGFPPATPMVDMVAGAISRRARRARAAS